MSDVIHPAIQQLDFTMLKRKLMDADEGEGWTPEFADKAIQEYRRYLHLVKITGSSEVVPAKMVDKVWHAHILDTNAYAPDCKKVFGEFLHHFPYWGMRGEEDLIDLYSAWNRTLALYKDTFKTESPLWESGTPARCPNCGVGSCFVAGTPITMADGSSKPVEALVIGDSTLGGAVTACMQFSGRNNPLFNYRGVLVSGSHAVLEDGRWVRVGASKQAQFVAPHAPALFCFSCEQHRVFVNGVTFADYDETDGSALDLFHRVSLSELNRLQTAA